MARVIGRTGSWIWWALGCLCALFFVREALGQEARPEPEYGVRVRPLVKQPVASEEQQKAAEKLVDSYLAPVEAKDPTAAQKTAIDAALKGLAAADFAKREAATAALVKIGATALTALREAAKDKDPEVASRASGAIAAIEKGARQPIVAELKKNPAARATISRRQAETRAAQLKALREAEDSKKAGKEDVAAAKSGEAKVASQTSAALTALMSAVSPDLGRAIAVYGIRVRPQE